MSTTRPTQAFLLAAGFGTRMQPLSDDLAKPLHPLWGKPAIAHTLELLLEWGVRDVLVNLHHQARQVFDSVRLHAPPGLRVNFSYEPDILGTGGALKKAAWFFGAAPTWIVNTDIAADLDPAPLLRAFRGGRSLAALWLTADAGPRTVECGPTGAIRLFRSARPGADGTFTFCGLQWVVPRLLRYLPPDAEHFSLVTLYERAMAAGERVAGVVVPGAYWADLGTPEHYLGAHRDILERHRSGRAGARMYNPRLTRSPASLRRAGAAVEGFAAVDVGASVKAGARLADSVLWSGVRAGSGVALRRAIVGRDTPVAAPLSGPVIRCDRAAPDARLAAALRALRWPADRTAYAPLPARGSARAFARLACRRRSAILVRYSAERPENAHYATIARFLRQHNVPVPRVLAESGTLCFQVLEDAGERDLGSAIEGLPPAQVEQEYRRVLDAVLALHAVPVDQAARLPLQPPFTPPLYRWERELFATHFLRGQLRLAEAEVAAILKELESVERVLRREPMVLLHRDLQSSNILLCRRQPVFIDFQGLRRGPAVYDLASLLCDPYVMLAPDLQERLLQYYAERSGRADSVRALFWFGAVQRLAQALGAYGRLSALPGTARFAAYIQPGLDMMHRALEHIGNRPALKQLCGRARLSAP